MVKEARLLRRAKSKSRTKSEARSEEEQGKPETGVNGREIVVLRETGRETDGAVDAPQDEKVDPEAQAESATGTESSTKVGRDSSGSSDAEKDQQPPTFRRDITFADEVRPPRNRADSDMRLPQPLSTEQHIAFLENQRRETGTLRIPSPREFDRGGTVQNLDSGRGDRDTILERLQSRNGDAPDHHVDFADRRNSEDMGLRQHITIDEPAKRQRSNTRSSTFPRLMSKRTTMKTDDDEDAPAGHRRTRSKTRTWNNMRTTPSQERDPTPYLTYQPTIGRNSAFVDLTEAEREELGGIEYRALKTLAVVLVSES